jgi:hypothetical protein
MKTKNKAAIRIKKRLRKLGLIPLFTLLVLGGCATTCPPTPCTCACMGLKAAPAFLAPATNFRAWTLLDARQAVENELTEAAAQTAVEEIFDNEHRVRELQADFELNGLQSQLDGLVQP